jgi:site-specific recombinase XerD
MHDLIPLPVDALPPGSLVPHAELETARAFAEHEKAAASRRAYNSDWAIFRSWCAHRALQPLPASPQAVAAFIAAEAQAGRRAATITRRLAAIRYAHKLAGISEPPTNSELVRSTMRGIRRTIGTAPAKKAPATADLIAAMLATCRTDLPGLRDRALIAFGFASAMRRSELVALLVEDLTETPEGYRVLVRRSKTDQEGQGQLIAIPTGSRLRPVEAVRCWLEAAAITSGPLFRRIDAQGRVVNAPLTAQAVALRVKRRAMLAGFDPSSLSGHSLRSGFITSAARSGASIWKLADQSRHRSMDTLRGYAARTRAAQSAQRRGHP